MAADRKKKVVEGEIAPARCVALADAGVRTGQEFALLMSALIGDIASKRIDAGTANAICNAGGKMLKVVEMQHKYGGPAKDDARKDLRLA